MSRKPLSLLLLALLGGVGVLAWRNMNTRSAAVDASQPVRYQREATRAVSQPTRLDFLGDTGQPYQARISLLRDTLSTGCSEPEIRFL